MIMYILYDNIILLLLHIYECVRVCVLNNALAKKNALGES